MPRVSRHFSITRAIEGTDNDREELLTNDLSSTALLPFTSSWWGRSLGSRVSGICDVCILPAKEAAAKAAKLAGN